MTIQAEGNYEKAKEMQARLGVIRPEVQRALEKMEKIPVDIEPRFVTAEKLLRGAKQRRLQLRRNNARRLLHRIEKSELARIVQGDLARAALYP